MMREMAFQYRDLVGIELLEALLQGIHVRVQATSFRVYSQIHAASNQGVDIDDFVRQKPRDCGLACAGRAGESYLHISR